jgi:hypothetical protein
MFGWLLTDKQKCDAVAMYQDFQRETYSVLSDVFLLSKAQVSTEGGRDLMQPILCKFKAQSF